MLREHLRSGEHAHDSRALQEQDGSIPASDLVVTVRVPGLRSEGMAVHCPESEAQVASVDVAGGVRLILPELRQYCAVSLPIADGD